IVAQFAPPPYLSQGNPNAFARSYSADVDFARWVRFNTTAHKQPGYRAVFVSLKEPRQPPGDMGAAQMHAVADLADRYSFGLIRTTHDQNLLLADVHVNDLYAVWQALRAQKLATPNIGTLTNIICCPGLDFCSLANASSIPIAKQINELFDDMDYIHDLGDIRIKMSGCMNACGHHHVGHIGILGVDKKGEEWYQITLGGSAEEETLLGDRLGPAVPKAEVAQTIKRILDVYIEQRRDDEPFLATVRRTGIAPFKAGVYGRVVH
ncbi:MAG: nitrite/sulfite reductase, partial [Gammaproteobacteria bacterium]